MLQSDIEELRDRLIKMPIDQIRIEGAIMKPSTQALLEVYLKNKFSVGTFINFVDDDETSMLKYNLTSHTASYSGYGVLTNILPVPSSGINYVFKMFYTLREDFKYVFYDTDSKQYNKPPKKIMTGNKQAGESMFITLNTSSYPHYGFFLSIREINEQQ